VPGVPAGALGEASVSETANGERPAIVPLLREFTDGP
jgi:hypothetical protein